MKRQSGVSVSAKPSYSLSAVVNFVLPSLEVLGRGNLGTSRVRSSRPSSGGRADSYTEAA